tara:strand:+ start:3833 stop:4045 length:213 start_codon:yes stop_codon:yes gene_type:complete
MDTKTTKPELKLSELLQSHNMSKRTVSRLAGISPALLTMMLNGERTFQYRHKDNIAMVLGVEEESINWNE